MINLALDFSSKPPNAAAFCDKDATASRCRGAPQSCWNWLFVARVRHESIENYKNSAKLYTSCHNRRVSEIIVRSPGAQKSQVQFRPAPVNALLMIPLAWAGAGCTMVRNFLPL
jgi:hypothetical protein